MSHYAKLATEHHGARTWDFAQGSFGQLYLRAGTKTISGICWATAISWIVGVEKESPLKAEVGSNGSLNKGAYAALIALQRRGDTKDQLRTQTPILSGLGLKVKSMRGDTRVTSGSHASAVSDWACEEANGYMTIHMNNSGSNGHVFATQIGRKSMYRVFDANEGEFTFAQKSHFKGFLRDFYAKRYGKKYSNFSVRYIGTN